MTIRCNAEVDETEGPSRYSMRHTTTPQGGALGGIYATLAIWPSGAYRQPSTGAAQFSNSGTFRIEKLVPLSHVEVPWSSCLLLLPDYD